MTRTYRVHSQLHAGPDGPIAHQQPIHIRQGALDGSCGQAAVTSALMLLGAIDRDELSDITTTRNKALAKLWKRSMAFYFSGTRPRELQSLLAPYQDHLSSRFVKKNQLAETVACLEENGVGIIGVSNNDFGHWVLAVGVSRADDDLEPDALLLLDSDAPPVPLSPWNAMLSVKGLKSRNGSKGQKHRYVSSAGEATVVIDNVLTITSLIEEIDLGDLDAVAMSNA